MRGHFDDSGRFSSFKNLQPCRELGRETSHHIISFLRILIEKVSRDFVQICGAAHSASIRQGSKKVNVDPGLGAQVGSHQIEGVGSREREEHSR